VRHRVNAESALITCALCCDKDSRYLHIGLLSRDLHQSIQRIYGDVKLFISARNDTDAYACYSMFLYRRQPLHRGCATILLFR
jgi:hypothetical protein